MTKFSEAFCASRKKLSERLPGLILDCDVIPLLVKINSWAMSERLPGLILDCDIQSYVFQKLFRPPEVGKIARADTGL